MIRLLLCLVVFACAAGCGQDDVAHVRNAAAPDAPATGAAEATEVFDAEVVLCRRVGSKTGKRIAVGDSFAESPEKNNRYINAFVDFTGVPTGVHQVHMVWIKPGGGELFRKFAEIAVAPVPEGYVTTVTWLEAEDLHDRQVEDPVVGAAAAFSLQTKLNVAPEKERDTGEYALRVYWNRELLIEKAFLFHAKDD